MAIRAEVFLGLLIGSWIYVIATGNLIGEVMYLTFAMLMAACLEWYYRRSDRPRPDETGNE